MSIFSYKTFFIITVTLLAQGGDGLSLSYPIFAKPLFNYTNASFMSVSKTISGTPSKLFYVQVNVGNPPFPVSLQLDTLSPLTWLQPADCEVCFPLSHPFDPINSSTFSPLASTNDICTPPLAYPSGDICLYDALYTNGYLGVDNFGSNNIAFGLGLNNTVDFDTGSGAPFIAGAIGLGLGHPSSIISQLNFSRFSWCLPGNQLAQATLDLGGAAFINQTVPGFHATPLAREDTSSFNYANLTFIRLNGEIVYMAVNPARPKATYVVLDVTYPLTLLASEAFYGLQGGVTGYFYQRYGWNPIEKSRSGYDLCFQLPDDMSRTEIVFPTIEMEFLHGAVLELKNSFQTVEDASEVCMTLGLFDPAGPNIVGTDQQLGVRFLVDYAQSTLSFAPDMC